MAAGTDPRAAVSRPALVLTHRLLPRSTLASKLSRCRRLGTKHTTTRRTRRQEWFGAVCEAAWTVLPLRGEPPLTRFLAEQLSTAHWYDMGPATRDFGYVPAVSIEEGLLRLAEAHAASR